MQIVTSEYELANIAKVNVLPGAYFGDVGEDYIRFSFKKMSNKNKKV